MVNFTVPSLQRARNLVRFRPSQGEAILAWSRIAGQIVELSEDRAQGALSGLAELILQAQSEGYQVAWIECGKTIFFPPDVAARGIDIEALTVVWAPDAQGALKACDTLLRSGAFSLVVVDGLSQACDDAVLARLGRLLEQQAVVFLTRKKPEAPTLGTQVSLRVAVVPGPTGIRFMVLKDKRAAFRPVQEIMFHGPAGLY